MRLLDAQLAAGVAVDASAFAREHGVSARTVYRHQARTRVEGEWSARSRRPHSSPRATPPDLVAWILKLRDDLVPDNGADFILDKLNEVHASTGPAWTVPARSTVNRVLARHDKLDRNPKKRPRSAWRRFSYARPRDCYQQDATEIVLADGSKAVAFEVLDDCTRTLVACRAHPAETAAGAIDAAQWAVREYGAPALWLTDNGAAFTARLTNPGKAISGFTRLVTGWGTRLIHSSPYHPQTCGKVERHHQTLKKWLRTQPPPATRADLQALLDTYRDYYNHHRRHSALPRRMTPAEAWASAESAGGPDHPPRQVDATLHRCTVDHQGKIKVAGARTCVGKTYAGATVTAIRDGEYATIYNANGQPIGRLHLDPAKRYVTLTKIE